jgi:hypothetical protein
MENKEEYKAVVYAGCSIESKAVSICNLEDWLINSRFAPRDKYQVWSDRWRFHQLYHNLDEAIDKFLELKTKRGNNEL